MDRVYVAARHRGRRGRRLARTLAGALLAAIALVSPLESGLLPGPAGGLAGSAEAQEPRTVDGVPDHCPSTRPPTEIDYRPEDEYQPNGDPSLCVVMLWACPASPLVNPTGLMRLSVAPEDSVLQRLFEFGHDPGDITYGDEGLELYPDFCEERVRMSESPTDYDTCVSLTGYAILDDGELCRILSPVTCVEGLHQDGSRTCRAVQRRSWTCDTDANYQPGNRFPTCFLTVADSDAEPACRPPGAPDLGVFAAGGDACTEYVGNDLLDPSVKMCSEYTTEPLVAGLSFRGVRSTQLRDNDGNPHWCRFPSGMLTLDCQDSGGRARCRRQYDSLCLKRASGAGGCDQVVATIGCRAHQFAYRRAQDRYLNARPGQGPERERVRDAVRDAARAAGCAPCVALPFEARSCDDEAAHVPDRGALIALGNNPLGPAYRRAIRILNCREDLDTDPVNQTPPCTPAAAGHCIDPPAGSLEWVSSHFAGLAVVGVPVIARIVDLPFEYPLQRSINYFPGGSQESVVMDSRWPPHYSDSDAIDRVPRFYSGERSERRATSVSGLISRECRPASPPLFDMIVEELWPDTDEHRDLISELFGADALAWWTDVGLPERKRLTAARGLRWWDDLGSESERSEEKERRLDILVSRIECRELVSGHEDPSPRTEPSCVWMPERPGYYRVVGVGGWPLTIAQRLRGWGGWSEPAAYGSSFDDFIGIAQQYVTDVKAAAPDELALARLHAGNRPYILLRRLVFGRTTNYDHRHLEPIFADNGIETGGDLLRYVLRTHFDGLTPAQAGLDDTGGTLTIGDPRPNPDGTYNYNDDWLYSEEAAGLTGCPGPVDLRVSCGGLDRHGGSYTETEPVGIIVHEVRTVTRPAVAGP
jgi:hypothetical protein